MNHLNENTLRIIRESAESAVWLNEHRSLIAEAIQVLAAVECDNWANEEHRAAFFGEWLGVVLSRLNEAHESSSIPRYALGYYGAEEFTAWLQERSFSAILEGCKKDREVRLAAEAARAASEAAEASLKAEETETEEEQG